MANVTSMEYLNILQRRVRCYLNRLQEEEAWEKYCASHNLRRPNAPPYLKIGNSKDESRGKVLSKTDQKFKNDVFSCCPQIKLKRTRYSSTHSEGDVLPDKGDVSKVNCIHSQLSVQKEFIIKTPCIRNRLVKALQATSVDQKNEQESRYLVERNSHKDIPRKDSLQIPVEKINNVDVISPHPRDDNTLKASSPERSIMKENVHHFKVPPTILFLESILWDELLLDTVAELERIAVQEAKRKKELLLLNFRKHLRNFQFQGQTVSEELRKEKEKRERKEIDPVKAFEDSFKNTKQIDSPARSKLPSDTSDKSKFHPLTKPAAIELKMSEESVQSVLDNRSRYANYVQRMWPPLSGIQDFHRSAIQIADSLLEDSMNEIILEVDQISSHVIHSCLAQEVGNC